MYDHIPTHALRNICATLACVQDYNQLAVAARVLVDWKITYDQALAEMFRRERASGSLNLADQLFAFLCQKYVQQADERQKQMGLTYTTAETHDLASEIAKFIECTRQAE